MQHSNIADEVHPRLWISTSSITREAIRKGPQALDKYQHGCLKKPPETPRSPVLGSPHQENIQGLAQVHLHYLCLVDVLLIMSALIRDLSNNSGLEVICPSYAVFCVALYSALLGLNLPIYLSNTSLH